MRSAAKIFYTAVFAFVSLANAEGHGSSEVDPMNKCAIDPTAMVSDACVSYGTINKLNDEIYTLLQSITLETDFFSYYRLNLFNKECPFWSDSSSMCGNIACSVNTIESEEDIPLVWRSEELSKLEGPKANHPPRKVQAERPKERPLQGMLGEGVGESCVVEYDDECDDRDYCVPEDEGSTGKGDYVSLVDNPERFTGYAGAGAHQVWDAVYRENCFMKPVAEELEEQSLNLPMGGLQAASDFRNVLQKESQRLDGLPLDNECLEKRVFHRLISGMHASISTHLCWDYLNQTTGEWHPNMQCYKDRLHNHPERISNMYFNYALVSRAVAKLRKHLQGYTFCTSDPDQDIETKQKINQLTDVLSRPPQIFDENLMFQDPSAEGLKEDFRNRFRNVSRLMDCVGCDKCRLWGKLQVNGYGTALKVLFEYDETKNGENPLLRRTELVSLINTLGRISHSLAAARSFHEALAAGQENAFPLRHSAPSTHTHVETKAEDKPKKKLFHDGSGRFYYENDEDTYIYGREKKDRMPWERPPPNPDASALDDIKTEWDMVWGTTMYVLRSWVDIPRTLLEITVWEAQRIWAFWLGLPVPPRPWKIQVPGSDATRHPPANPHSEL
ncbi:Endoplasmic reticulum oxidoreductin-1 [Penicillium macrosclerotiorum]|uniref:Endoplasmic reticulum oxidoreductin-1 n=1 Tax=Penicillium macrosclerotiorum TaxID=303699 RepID=UPI0025471CE1|nr:Endoplasmic reticulum oxidoreductin-1 [Penicillium macrosclerotiorum]KAJ5664610.1 Endoplasmic reticulum oxidoreductin-1 [Penicillium macrosclerotiorum]